jgi:hypothetical protein
MGKAARWISAAVSRVDRLTKSNGGHLPRRLANQDVRTHAMRVLCCCGSPNCKVGVLTVESTRVEDLALM